VRGLLLVLLSLVAVGVASGAEDVTKADSAAPRILYSSDWSGTWQIYAADPSGRRARGQLTFGRAPACLPDNPCGYVAPVPSPDGRRIVFRDYVLQGPARTRLFVARADGTARRRLALVSDFRPGPATWSPDSRQIAYGTGDGIWLVEARGSRPRSLARTERVWHLAWSPSGKWLAYTSSGLHLVRPNGSGKRKLTSGGLPSFSWSPDGRLLAFADGGIRIADLATGKVRTLTAHSGSQLAWSPDGRLLAYAADEGIEVVDTATGSSRILTTDSATALAWSPDGGRLAYVRQRPKEYGLYPTTELRVVDRRGTARTVVASAAAYGGVISEIAWTRPPARLRSRRPERRSLATVSPDGLTARWPIQRLAADGGRVAYLSCGHAFVWTPARGSVEQAEPQASLSPRCNTPTYSAGLNVYSLAVAGDRVAFGLIGGGNTTFWWLGGTTLTQSRPSFTIGEGRATTATPRTDFVSDLAGSGPLLVFSSADQANRQPCCGIVTTTQEVVRVGSAGCPCSVIASEPGPFVPYDVDAGRIAAAGDNAVVLLDGEGSRLLTVHVKARAAQLAAGELVVAAGADLRQYDAATGALVQTWPLPEQAKLEDVSRGLAAYVLDGQLHLLRLADGADRVVGAGILARFMDAGLVYVDGSRLVLVPFGRLPLR
jgi:Tol biopolymer transport system component